MIFVILECRRISNNKNIKAKEKHVKILKLITTNLSICAQPKSVRVKDKGRVIFARPTNEEGAPMWSSY